MTAWLDFRTEPIVAEEDDYIVGVVFPPKVQPYVQCTCGFNDTFASEAEAEGIKFKHMKWHEDGMPE